MNRDSIVVSVCMTTYYHEAYIAQAIESVLTQRVNFDYEIIICDDCSKDRTQEIIKEYADKYTCIKYKFNDTNIGLTKNVFQARCMAEGKYVIPLSGDDYWIDENKMKKQVEFIDTHPEYFGVATRIETRRGNSTKASFIEPPINTCDKQFTIEDFLGGKNFPMNGVLIRNPVKANYGLFSLMPKLSPYIDDITDCLLVLMMGDIYILNDVTVAYRRVLQEGKSNFNSINKGIGKFEKRIELLNNIYSEFGTKFDFFVRYRNVLGTEIGKNYRIKTRKKFKEIVNTIPMEYRKRGIVFHSVLYIIPKTLDVLLRSFRK